MCERELRVSEQKRVFDNRQKCSSIMINDSRVFRIVSQAGLRARFTIESLALRPLMTSSNTILSEHYRSYPFPYPLAYPIHPYHSYSCSLHDCDATRRPMRMTGGSRRLSRCGTRDLHRRCSRMARTQLRGRRRRRQHNRWWLLSSESKQIGGGMHGCSRSGRLRGNRGFGSDLWSVRGLRHREKVRSEPVIPNDWMWTG